jgi:hypothetical protein
MPLAAAVLSAGSQQRLRLNRHGPVPDRAMKKSHLIFVLLLALAVRAQLFLAGTKNQSGFFTRDSESYLVLAEAIRFGREFAPDYSDRNPPEIFRTPGYPAFIAADESAFLAVDRLWDHRPAQDYFDAFLLSVIASQVVIDVLLVGLTCWLGAKLVGAGVGLLAGLLQALSPLAIGASCRYLSDSLYAFVFTAAILFMVAHLQRGRWWSLLAAALALGAACYVRPVAQTLAPVFALVLLFFRSPRFPADRVRPLGATTTSPCQDPAVVGGCGQQRRNARHPILRRCMTALLFLVIFGACIAPWIVRNGVRADYWSFSSVFGDTLYGFAAKEVAQVADPEAAARLAGQDSYHRGILDAPPGNSPAREASPGVLARWRQKEALAIISAHPWTYAQLHAKGCLAFWLPGTDALEIVGLTTGNRGTLDVLHKDGLWAATKHYFGDDWKAIALAVPIAIFTLVQYLGGILCVWWGLRGRFRAHVRIAPAVWLLVLIVIVSCLVSGTTGTPRFRVPVEPILNVAAAAGIVGLFRRKDGEKSAAPVSNSVAGAGDG